MDRKSEDEAIPLSWKKRAFVTLGKRNPLSNLVIKN
jgi:hypothetical protein